MIAITLKSCRKPITSLWFGISYLWEYKFKYSFHKTINPLCGCGHDVESTEHFLLHCPQFVNERRTLVSTIGNIDHKFYRDFKDIALTNTLFFRNTSFDTDENTRTPNVAINHYFHLSNGKIFLIYSSH